MTPDKCTLTFLVKGLEWHWKAFVEGKVSDYLDRVQQVEGLVADTVDRLSEQVAGLVKQLSDTIGPDADLEESRVKRRAALAWVISPLSTPSTTVSCSPADLNGLRPRILPPGRRRCHHHTSMCPRNSDPGDPLLHRPIGAAGAGWR
jgi:hypothetical protein